MKAIEAKNLQYRYDEEQDIFALKKVSFFVEEGEYVSIIGHNGSGKSTLARLLMGLIEDTTKESEILFFGEKLTEQNALRIRKSIGIVFQNPDNQFIGSTVADDIAFGLENDCVPQQEMEAIIQSFAKKVGMENFLDKEPSMLSGGQKQRVAIAGALAKQPSILIFDEATAMLDPKGRKEVMSLIQQMKQENPKMTVLSITHHMDEVVHSDRVLVINEGQIVFNDTPENVFQHHQTLSSIGLDLPFFHKLKQQLFAKGLQFQAADEEGMVDELCR